MESTEMKIYIAAPYPTRRCAEQMGKALAMKGHTITSIWHDANYSAQCLRRLDASKDAPLATAMLWREFADVDHDGIIVADLVIVVNPDQFEQSGTGGRHVELGIARTLGKRILLVGNRTNTFMWDLAIHQIDEGGDFLKAVNSLQS